MSVQSLTVAARGGGSGGGGATAVLTITQSAATLVIETKRGDQVTTATTISMVARAATPARVAKARARSAGTALVIASESTFNGPNGAMTVTSNEVRSLSADGKTMTVVRTSHTPNGDMTRKTVYDRE